MLLCDVTLVASCCHQFVVLVECVSYKVGHVVSKAISHLELLDSFSIAEFLKSYSYWEYFLSGQSDDRSNYRPISVLPFLSTVFEKLVFNQLYKYLEKTSSYTKTVWF